MTNDSRLVLALDITDISKAEDVARQAEGKVRAIKINWPLVMTSGIGIVGRIGKYADILCDLKVADIPNTNRLITEKVRDNGAWGIITHIFPGSDSLMAVKKASGDMKVFGVAAMSHPGASEFMTNLRDRFLKLAIESDIYGIIAPGNDYDVTRDLKSRAGNLKIATPGVGAQGGTAGDAIRSGSDYVIVGRSIYESEDPSEKMESINEEIRRVVELK